MKLLLISFYILLFLYRKLILQSHAAQEMDKIWSASILENVNIIRGLSKNVLSADTQSFLADDTLFIKDQLRKDSGELDDTTFEFYRRNKANCVDTSIRAAFAQNKKEKIRIGWGGWAAS
ncbi:Hypothetical protein FKW44_002173 [Caligus rogercresseyi]|uniref:Uncharacterized protein n=1 Tax=Caligus rogercresseyi TaxID=217165 RepID=A0A7T8KK14_CALRO|nr:Hypothetical protein FKW44_002173 [Caligus rogercresseyi]